MGEKYKDNVKEFGFMSKTTDSQKYLQKYPDLVCDHTASFLVVWCIDLCVEEKEALMNQVAHQTISMQFILELAKGLKKHPADCFGAFYKRLEVKDTTKEGQQYHSAFLDELSSFKQRVKQRAAQRLVEAEEKVRQEQEAERGDRIEQSPGGIDPAEVFDALPEELQTCFVERDTERLQNLINGNPKKYINHMQLCVLSGLWVPSEDSPLYKLLSPDSEHNAAASAEEAKKIKEKYPDYDHTKHMIKQAKDAELAADAEASCKIEEVSPADEGSATQEEEDEEDKPKEEVVAEEKKEEVKPAPVVVSSLDEVD